MSQKLVISGNYLIVEDSELNNRIWRHTRGGIRWYLSPDDTEYTIHHEDDGKEWTYLVADAVDIADSPLGVAALIQFLDENTGFNPALGGSLADYQELVEKGVADGYAELDSGGEVPIGQLPTIDEDNMASDSDQVIPTQQSVKAYVDGAVAGVVTLIGEYNASTNTPDLDVSPSGVNKDDMYVVSVAGTFFSASLEIGDVIISKQDNPTAEAHWILLQKNLDAVSIKSLYESNANTNALTDALQTDVQNILKAEYRNVNFTAVPNKCYLIDEENITVTLPATLSQTERIEFMFIDSFEGSTRGPVLQTASSGAKIKLNNAATLSTYVNSYTMKEGERVVLTHSADLDGNTSAVTLITNMPVQGDRSSRKDPSTKVANFTGSTSHFYEVGDNGGSPIVVGAGWSRRHFPGSEITFKSIGTVAPDISAFGGLTMDVGELCTIRYTSWDIGWHKVQTNLQELPTPASGGSLGDIKASALTEAQMLTQDTNWVPCDGRVILGSAYAALTGASLAPDLRGKFMRGYDPTNIIDQDTRLLLDTQQDAFEEHAHPIPHVQNYTPNGTDPVHTTNYYLRTLAQGAALPADRTFNEGGGETRPVNMVVNYFIKIN